ncbi:MAG: YaiI/YqxD family protein [Fibrobacteria bacterium]|nr:YaiI/YqxD family protein [Fibrobacteria bacterium]
MKILVDADACPRSCKELLFKTSDRREVHLVMVANQRMAVTPSEWISFVVVSAGADVADDHIVEIMEKGDLIISADIPLASRVIKKGGVVLDPRGVYLTDENIGQRLATRNLMEDLRSSGVQTGGPDGYGGKEKQEFSNQLDKFLSKALRTP